MMTELTVTLRGQVTLRQEILRHLGIQPGQKIRLDMLPDGRAELRAAKQKGSFEELRGFLKGKTNGRVLSVEQIGEIIAEAASVTGK